MLACLKKIDRKLVSRFCHSAAKELQHVDNCHREVTKILTETNIWLLILTLSNEI